MLGAGGMGEVFRARDDRLRRDVAIKRLPARTAADPESRRDLLREARSAARISHQNVAVLHDVIEEGDDLYLVMELVEGETLRRRLERAITLDAILDIAAQCCQGLSAAHREGVVHGDIKPDNIMVGSDGTVKILDFGVASIAEPIRDDDATQTALATGPGGGAAGTVPFMAPEVLLGNEFDRRADIFSLGITLYSMLTGAHPFAANTGAGTVDKILNQHPIPVLQLNPRVPAQLLPVLEKMLSKAPEERYATADDLLVDLRTVRNRVTRPGGPPSAPANGVDGAVSGGPPSALPAAPAAGAAVRPQRLGLAAGVLAIAVVAVLAWQLWPMAEVAPPVAASRFDATDWVIAVLPSDMDSADADPEMVALKEGLAATLTSKLTQLSRAHSLQVIPMSAVRARNIVGYAAARKELGVTLVVDFHMRIVGETLRVNVNLIDTAAERQLDATTIDGAVDDPITLEEQVAIRALRMLRLELAPMEQSLLAAGTDEPRAHGYFLRAMGYLQETDTESIDAAVNLLEQALRVDPDYASAHAALGEAFWHRYRRTDGTAWVARAAEECDAAIALNPDDGAGYRCLGTVYTGTGRAAEGAAELEHAKQLDPTDDTTYLALGNAYLSDGRIDLAEATYEEAIALRPHYWGGYNWLGVFYLREGRLAEAIDNLEQVVLLAPDSYRGFSNLGVAFYRAEDWTQARRAFERALELNPEYNSALSNIGTLYFFEGDYSASAGMYERAIEFAADDYLMWGNLGDAYFWSGAERAQVLAAFQRAIELADAQLQVNPADGGLHADVARYAAMIDADARARTHLARAMELAGDDADVLHTAAQASEMLGDREAALEYLRRAMAGGYQRAEIDMNPIFGDLREDARYADISAG
jgi:serine/threonine-protein kinase